MPLWVMPPIAGLIEPVPAPEIYIDGIGAIEIADHMARMFLYAEELSIAGGETCRIVKVIIRRPAKNVAQAIGCLASLAHAELTGIVPQSADGPARGIPPRLVT